MVADCQLHIYMVEQGTSSDLTNGVVCQHGIRAMVTMYCHQGRLVSKVSRAGAVSRTKLETTSNGCWFQVHAGLLVSRVANQRSTVHTGFNALSEQQAWL